MKDLPTNCLQASLWIWDEQNLLNKISHPSEMGTLDIGNSNNIELQEQVLWDYRYAMLSEINEAMENLYWKHWSKEAKDGNRFKLISSAEDGEGTLQNLRLELIDCLFFLVSYLQASGSTSHMWINSWGDEQNWEDVKNDLKLESLSLEERNKLLLQTLLKLNGNLSFPDLFHFTPLQLMQCFILTGLNWNDVLNLYSKKLKINQDRQARGRKQVGDEHAEQENKSVK
jgi:hypothetical protein